MPLMVGVQRNVAFDEANDVAHVVALVAFVDHGDGYAFTSSTPRAANAVHVGFADVGDFEVDDVADTFHVDAAGSDVRGHKNSDFAFAERVHRLFPLGLAFVAVNRFSADVVLFQVAHHLVGAVLGAREHQGGVHLGTVEDVYEEIALGALADKQHALVDRFCRTAHAGHFDPDGVGENGFGQLDNAVGHRGAEEQTLSLFWQHGDHPADVVDEAHVEHGVGFVQDQKLDPLQRQQPLVAQVEKTAWRGDEHVGAFPDLGDLFVLAHAAKNQRRPHLDVLRVGLDVVVDLSRQLSGRGENEHTWHGTAVHHVVGQVVHQGQGEGGGLAGSCLGNAHHVTAFEHVRDGLFLNGGGALVTERNEGFEHLRVQAHVNKFHEKMGAPRIKRSGLRTGSVKPSFCLVQTSKGACRPR